MKLIWRIVLAGLVSLDIAVTFQGASTSAAISTSVAGYGAQCDGVTDDRAAIQSALNAAAAAGGGTVTLPSSTCLLNSFAPSSHPWQFYNLHIPSNVTLQGVAGSKLLQGPGGRQSISNIRGAALILNTVIAVGNDYATIHFQNSGNGGFYSLQAMTVGSPSVTLSTAAQAANFAIGDYVAIYEYTSGDVLPAQMTEITGVNVASGQLTLADPVIRPFAAPSIAKVTSLAAHDVAINGVIVQGAIPLSVTETFNFSASNNQFLSDTSIGGGNVSELEMSTVEHFTFSGNTIAAINGPYIHQELCQRDSQNGVWTGNTFQDAAVGFGEYAANITMTNNHIYLYPDGSGIGIALGGMNVLFSGNDVHTMGNQTGASPWGFIVADVYAPAYYYAYTGNIQIANNTIQCVANGDNCLLLVGNGTVASGNTITATGSATGVSVADWGADVSNNTINIGNGIGIFLQPFVDAATVAGNTLSGTGPFGIYVADPPTPASGSFLIQNNTMQGFATHLYINLSLQPGAILSNNH
jgi:hypothetical protein